MFYLTVEEETRILQDSIMKGFVNEIKQALWNRQHATVTVGKALYDYICNEYKNYLNARLKLNSELDDYEFEISGGYVFTYSTSWTMTMTYNTNFKNTVYVKGTVV